MKCQIEYIVKNGCSMMEKSLKYDIKLNGFCVVTL